MARSSAAKNISTAFTKRWPRRNACSRTSSTSTDSGSSWMTSAPVIKCWAWSTVCTNRSRGASRTTSPSRVSTVTSPCIRPCSDPKACRSRSRFEPAKWTAWPSPASHPTGSTRRRTRKTRHRNGARGSGSRTSRSCRSRGPPRNSWRASRSTCSPTRFTCSRPRATSCLCPKVRRPSTSLMPCIPISAIAAWRRRSIAASCHCAPNCRMARQ